MIKRLILGCVIACALTACGLENYPGGDLPTQARLDAIHVGDSKEKVLRVLGAPATDSLPLSDGSSFLIYAQNMKISQMFFDPKETSRDVYAYYFNSQDTLIEQKHLTLADKVSIKYDSHQTDVGGKEMSVWEQVIQNFGRYNTGSQDSTVRH